MASAAMKEVVILRNIVLKCEGGGHKCLQQILMTLEKGHSAVNLISLPAIISSPEAYSNRHAPSNEFPFTGYSASSLSFP